MNKKLAAFISANQMTINGNSAYGQMNGYETNILYNCLDSVAPVKLHISFYATDLQKREIENALRNASIKFFTFKFTSYGLLIGLNDLTVNKLIKRLPSILDLVYGSITENGCLGWGYCPVCGNPVEHPDDKKHVVDGITIVIDDSCVNNINTVIDAENKDFNDAPNNYLLGFVGALIGGIVGGLLSAILYMVGYVSSISAIVAALLGAFLYQKFHGKPNKMMVVIVTLTTIICMAVSVVLIYIVASGIAASEADVTLNAFEAFAVLMRESEFAECFYRDLALVLVFSVFGILLEILYLVRKIKRQKNIK